MADVQPGHPDGVGLRLHAGGGVPDVRVGPGQAPQAEENLWEQVPEEQVCGAAALPVTMSVQEAGGRALIF